MLSFIAAPVHQKSRAALFLIALLTFASAARAADPDYSGVKDILRGRRTLLSINDLVIGGTVMKTSDGTKIEDKNISELLGFRRRAGEPEIMARLVDSKSRVLVYLYQRSCTQ